MELVWRDEPHVHLGPQRDIPHTSANEKHLRHTHPPHTHTDDYYLTKQACSMRTAVMSGNTKLPRNKVHRQASWDFYLHMAGDCSSVWLQCCTAAGTCGGSWGGWESTIHTTVRKAEGRWALRRGRERASAPSPPTKLGQLIWFKVKQETTEAKSNRFLYCTETRAGYSWISWFSHQQ